MRLLKFLPLLFLAAPAFAQQGGGVVQVGTVTANDCVAWVGANRIKDAGTTCGGGGGSGTVTSVAQTFTGGLISVSGSPITTAGTLALTVAGTSGGIPYFSSASTWATSAALAANALVIGGGAGAAPATTTTGTGVVTALGIAVNGSGAISLTTSPSFVTPVLGVAAGTSLALNGATIGANALAVTGNTQLGNFLGVNTTPSSFTGQELKISGGIYLTNSINMNTSSIVNINILAWNSDSGISRISANLLGVGNGTAADFSGGLKLTSFTATGASVILSGLAADAATTDSTVCVKSSDGTILKGSGTLGICLGTSSARYKTDIRPLTAGLGEVLALPSKTFYLDEEHGDPMKQMYGFTAEDCAKVLPKLVGFDIEGRANTCDYLGVVPVLVHAIQQQQEQIDALRAMLR